MCINCVIFLVSSSMFFRFLLHSFLLLHPFIV
ncbi:unnamed protein product [Spirodela intermedia]|uniref:Uncharacterized protein n=1 Tax=Spirodela intermedia TaxID=51605 RepID=A0A7I8KIN0_SPIIN|nr:unnamed protein product [Spirodela intermedia]